MEKYYTPTIEEFHVGFEYEFRHNDYKQKGWIKYKTPIFDFNKEDSPFSYTNLNQFRVKCLDKEDIESLGFVLKAGDTRLTYHYGGHAISHTPSSNKIDIYYYDGSEFVNRITIKNKSELKKLLKQLNIL